MLIAHHMQTAANRSSGQQTHPYMHTFRLYMLLCTETADDSTAQHYTAMQGTAQDWIKQRSQCSAQN
jgi:hypothetical protein